MFPIFQVRQIPDFLHIELTNWIYFSITTEAGRALENGYQKELFIFKGCNTIIV